MIELKIINFSEWIVLNCSTYKTDCLLHLLYKQMVCLYEP